ncbi:MAG: M23 family metallopeptidase [Candidatus Accumulibacter sp.]|nr:M23 family metallopeptidase [Accumulibacter sp.]
MKPALFVCLLLFYSLRLSAGQLQNYPFVVETVKDSAGQRVVARNNGPAPVSVMVALTASRNVSTDRPFPVHAVVPPGARSVQLARIRPATAGAAYSFRTRSSWLLGDFNARQSPAAIYRLPYPDGLAFHIGQAAGGPLISHKTPDSQYAVDIGMPEGTPVVAARDGLVIDTEANQIRGGRSPDLMGKANAVRIQHRDGTIAVYAHLAHGGVLVRRGQRVKVGMRIGLSGSTGYSSGPHLHFAVQTVLRSGDRLTMLSLPFRFYVGSPPAVFAPRTGMFVTAQYVSPGRIPSAVPAGGKALTLRPGAGSSR